MDSLELVEPTKMCKRYAYSHVSSCDMLQQVFDLCFARPVLQRVAACCSVLQCIEARCSVLQCLTMSVICYSRSLTRALRAFLCVTRCCSVLHCHAVRCSTLQCVAVHCSVLQCVLVCCSVEHCVAARCSVLQWVAVCFAMLQCFAVCCSALQRSACDWLCITCRIHVRDTTPDISFDNSWNFNIL